MIVDDLNVLLVIVFSIGYKVSGIFLFLQGTLTLAYLRFYQRNHHSFVVKDGHSWYRDWVSFWYLGLFVTKMELQHHCDWTFCVSIWLVGSFWNHHLCIRKFLNQQTFMTLVQTMLFHFCCFRHTSSIWDFSWKYTSALSFSLDLSYTLKLVP